MNILPIRVQFGYGHHTGYTRVLTKGELKWSRVSEKPLQYAMDDSNVKYQVFVANWLYYIPTVPIYIWRRIIAALWGDRHAQHFERGLAAGLRQAYYEPSRIDQLTQDERASLFGITVEQVRRLDRVRDIESWMPADLVARIKKQAAEAQAEIAAQEKP